MIRIFSGIILMLVLFISVFFSKVEVYNDISKYNEFIGTEAIEQYKNKWGMDEEIFPERITDNMNVKDFKMVYYNPWDAQYLSYLVVDYNKEEYKNEINRLKEYKSTNYIGYYGVTGFSKYTLLAMNADEYQGFVYALTDNESRIIYVELIFCNGFYDLKYENYINTDYLPDGFDAEMDNPYQQRQSKTTDDESSDDPCYYFFRKEW